MTLKST